MSQESIFLEGEGDAWFERNKDKLANSKRDIPFDLIEMYAPTPNRVLEVGCANGFRLNKIQQKWSSECWGIEPSLKAIWHGEESYPGIRFECGTAQDGFRFEYNDFDLVIVNFVLHWVSRDKLLKSISEIDRVLSDNGVLILGDFATLNPIKRKYHHLPDQDMWTYKQDYAGLFEKTGLYKMDYDLSFNEERYSVLRKDLSKYYIEEI